MKFLISLLLFYLLRVNCACENEEEKVNCANLEEALNEANSNWKSLTINSEDNFDESGILQANSFLKAPNLEELTISGLLVDIEPNAFSGLNNLKSLTFSDNSIKILKKGSFTGKQISYLLLNSSICFYLHFRI